MVGKPSQVKRDIAAWPSAPFERGIAPGGQQHHRLRSRHSGDLHTHAQLRLKPRNIVQDLADQLLPHETVAHNPHVQSGGRTLASGHGRDAGPVAVRSLAAPAGPPCTADSGSRHGAQHRADASTVPDRGRRCRHARDRAGDRRRDGLHGNGRLGAHRRGHGETRRRYQGTCHGWNSLGPAGSTKNRPNGRASVSQKDGV
mmetsp:Transcript_76639/g.221539  ORF Transcript_76639/g.221539 Transcript_76639/m.221539 type:complete len:200 (+) Transcript_76639:472-1071(+)